MDDREDIVHVVVPSKRVDTVDHGRGGTDVLDASTRVEVEEPDGQTGTIGVVVPGECPGDGARDGVVGERRAQAEPAGTTGDVRPVATRLLKVDAVRVGVVGPAFE